MNPSQIYQQEQASHATRIELILALYDKAIGQLSQAQQALERHELSTATPLLLQAQLIVYALATGVDSEEGEVPRNLLRLYEFVLYCLGFGEVGKVKAALGVLTILREGLAGIEQQAKDLELRGHIPPLKAAPALRMRA